jgi:phosphohistidine phosphatase
MNMQVYFFRHAIAEEREDDDFARKLTEKGIRKTRQAAAQLKPLGVKPTRLYTSPLIRARETADILAEALGITAQVREELAPGFNLAALEQLVRDLETDDDLMIVGHEPSFSATISAFIGGGRIDLKKGGMARINVTSTQPLEGELVWLLAPKAFNTAGES